MSDKTPSPGLDPAQQWGLLEVVWDFEGKRIVGGWIPPGGSEGWRGKVLDSFRRDLRPECAATLRVELPEGAQLEIGS